MNWCTHGRDGCQGRSTAEMQALTRVSLGVGMLLTFIATTTHATEPYQEYRKHVESAQNITALTDALMGDSVSLYNGATQFEAVDIALPGNNRLAVELRRSFSVEIVPTSASGTTPGDPDYRGIANWSIDVPYIATTWGPTAWPSARCSAPTMPSAPAPLVPSDLWQGHSVHLPGAAERKLLRLPLSGAPAPSDGQTWQWSSRERDMVACIPMQSGLAGDGFLLKTSDGTTYRFDVATTRTAGTIQYKQPGDNFVSATAARTRYYILASRVTDRFGNFVDYSYNAAGHPSQISSSDGRHIDLTYSAGRLSSASAHGRTWTYQYGAAGADSEMLVAVLQPDGSTWGYTHAGSLRPDDGGGWDGASNASCGIKPPTIPAAFTLNVKHPAGSNGTFVFSNRRHPRSGIHINQCSQRAYTPVGGSTQYSYKLQTPNYFDVMSLASKQISGPGMQTMTWTYDYPSGNVPLWGNRGANQPYPCTACPSEKVVKVSHSDGTSTEHTFGYLYASNEGRLLATDKLDSAGVVKRRQRTTYVSDAEAQGLPFFGTYGIYGFGFGTDDASVTAIRPIKAEVTEQDGVAFEKQTDASCGSPARLCFDRYAPPTRTTRSSRTLP